MSEMTKDSNGNIYWFKNGVLHYEYGPAVEYKDGHEEWWLDGQRITEDEFSEWRIRKELDVLLNAAFTIGKEEKKVTDEEGNVFYYQAGMLHREDGPAIEWVRGCKEWLVDGRTHREDGPAVVHEEEGYFVWYRNGNRHREDGPAVIYGNGDKEWWLKGVQLTKEEYKFVKENILSSENLKKLILEK